jgi:hypothetical protein
MAMAHAAAERLSARIEGRNSGRHKSVAGGLLDSIRTVAEANIRIIYHYLSRFSRTH